MILIVNHTESDDTIAFEPVPRDRMMLLIDGYFQHPIHRGNVVTISYPGRGQSQLKGKIGDQEFYKQVQNFFYAIVNPPF